MFPTWIRMHCWLSLSKTSTSTIWFEFLNTLWSMRYCLVGGGGQLVVKRSGRFKYLDLLICILGSFETIINNNVCSINTQEYYSWRNTKDMAIVYVCTVSVGVCNSMHPPGVVPSPVLGGDWLALHYSVAVTTAEGPPLTRGEYRVLQWRPTSHMAIKRFLNCDIWLPFDYWYINL